MGKPFKKSSTFHRSERRERGVRWANKSEQTKHPGEPPVPPPSQPPEILPPSDRKKPAQECVDQIAKKRESLDKIFRDNTGIGNGKPPSKPKQEEDKKPSSGNKRAAWTAISKTLKMLDEDTNTINACMQERKEKMDEQDKKHEESVQARQQWENDVNVYEKKRHEYEQQLKRHEEAKEYYREFAKNGMFPPEKPPEDWENRPSKEDIKKGRYHLKGINGAKKPSEKPPRDDSYGGNRKNPTGGDGAWLPDVLKDPDSVPHDWHAPMKKPEKKEKPKDPEIPYRRVSNLEMLQNFFIDILEKKQIPFLDETLETALKEQKAEKKKVLPERKAPLFKPVPKIQKPESPKYEKISFEETQWEQEPKETESYEHNYLQESDRIELMENEIRLEVPDYLRFSSIQSVTSAVFPDGFNREMKDDFEIPNSSDNCLVM